ncbi:Protein OS-9 [Fusarium oxysporum]|nr:Protein OS-9 [Fusarium oxysporum]
MRRFNLFLLATVQLAGARSPGFSIHEDLLTYPQFEVVFDSQYISEKDAHSLLDSQHPTYSADFAQSTLDQAREADERDNEGDNQGQNGPSHTYELMKLPPPRIPLLYPYYTTPPNPRTRPQMSWPRPKKRASLLARQQADGNFSHNLKILAYTLCQDGGATVSATTARSSSSTPSHLYQMASLPSATPTPWTLRLVKSPRFPPTLRIRQS